MKRFVIAVTVGVLFFAVIVWGQKPAEPKGGSVEQELIKLENGWNDASVKRDVAFLDKILAEDITDTDAEGAVWTKTQDLQNVKSGDFALSSAVADTLKVRVYGGAAVVTGRNTIQGKFKGKDISGQYQFTDTWVKHADRWQCVASHGSKIVQK
jgi:hypothetical protein